MATMATYVEAAYADLATTFNTDSILDVPNMFGLLPPDHDSIFASAQDLDAAEPTQLPIAQPELQSKIVAAISCHRRETFRISVADSIIHQLSLPKTKRYLPDLATDCLALLATSRSQFSRLFACDLASQDNRVDRESFVHVTRWYFGLSQPTHPNALMGETFHFDAPADRDAVCPMHVDCALDRARQLLNKQRPKFTSSSSKLPSPVPTAMR